MIWNEHIECMDREQIEKLQSQRLCEMVERVYYNVPFYRKKMQVLGLEIGDIKGIEDLHKLPFTTKDDLRENYPFGMFAVPMSQVVRVHASSGTTGLPTVVGYTRTDLSNWSEIVARALYGAGVSKEDRIQNSYGYGLFTGGLGLHGGAEKVGATILPLSGGNTRKQIQSLVDFEPTAISCTPSYLLYLAETLKEEELLDKIKLRVAILGAEPWTENMRKEIEKQLNIKAIDIYGLSEIMGPGVSFECINQCGSHIAEDHFIPEIIDPKTLKPLPRGSEGELVFTTITKEALPLFRYRTKDLSSLIYETCECGRTSVRMTKITGRTDDMLIIRGVNVFPSQIESALLEIGETQPHYMIYVDRVNNLDTLEVWVEVDEKFFSDEIKQLEALTRKITKQIVNIIGISVKVKLVEPKTILRSEGKAKRVVDRRHI
jgi:phenylacetate-CoA ligase